MIYIRGQPQALLSNQYVESSPGSHHQGSCPRRSGAWPLSVQNLGPGKVDIQPVKALRERTRESVRGRDPRRRNWNILASPPLKLRLASGQVEFAKPHIAHEAYRQFPGRQVPRVSQLELLQDVQSTLAAGEDFKFVHIERVRNRYGVMLLLYAHSIVKNDARTETVHRA